MGKIILPNIHFSRLPPLFCLSFGAFLGVVLTALLLEGRELHKRSELISSYGDSLVALVAQDAAESMVTDDLLSLHAVMQGVVNIPRVKLAVVRDVDQVLLVQAGNLQQYQNYQVFTAPVSLHDSMAGYVSLTMDVGFEGEAAFYWVFLAAVILLLLMSGLALFEVRKHVFEWVVHPELPVVEPSSQEASSVEPEEVLRGELESDTFEQEKVLDLGYTDLILSLPNYPSLESQLSDIVFSRRVALFERQFGKVLALYSGSQVETPGMEGIYCLRFKNHLNHSESTFSAVCTAFLIQSIEESQKIKFQLLAEICSQDADIKLARSGCGIFVQNELVDNFLRERLVLEGGQFDRALVVGLRGDYALLLEQQMEQLKAYL